MKNKLYIVLAVLLAAIVAYAFYLDQQRRDGEIEIVEDEVVEVEESPVEEAAEPAEEDADPTPAPAAQNPAKK